MVLRCSCITFPVLSHPFIPPSHILFMLLLNVADCQFLVLLFHQVVFFLLSAGQISHLLFPTPSLFHLLFTSYSSPLFSPPYAHLTNSVSFTKSVSLIHFLSPLSMHRRCNWSTTFPHIVIFKSPFASPRRESGCFIMFSIFWHGFRKIKIED